MNPQWRELRDYQEAGLDFVTSRPHAGLFVDMGLGKTAISLHAFLELPKPILLVGPIRVIESVWRQEAKIWPGTTKIRFTLLRGNPNQRKAAAQEPADVYLVNPELLEEALLLRSDYKTLLIDESTMFKDPSTKRFKGLRKHLRRFTHRYILTGTPAPNGLLNLWAQIFILDLGERLGTSFGKFKQTYFYPTDFQGYKFAAHDWAKDVILAKISDLVFRMDARDALPPRKVIRNIIRFPLPPAARTIYRDLEREALARITKDETVSGSSAVVVMAKLRQVASGFVYDDDQKPITIHLEKIKIVEEILEQTSEPIIVLYQFRHELAALQKAFPQGRIFDSNLVEPWNAGEIPLMFLHPQSGGHGINLQYGGHLMVVFTASFSLEQMSQAMARIDRQGQTAPVIFHHLVAEETVDELLLEVLDQKAGNQAEVLKLIKEYADGKQKPSRR